jgi:anti-sigma B factor antagonist
MELTIQITQDNCTIVLAGDLDMGSCLVLDTAIKKVLAEELALKSLAVDCRQLAYISSAGLGVFIENLQEMEKRRIALIFYGMNGPVREIFSITGLDSFVTILDSTEEMPIFC